jgi:hypothetical protein
VFWAKPAIYGCPSNFGSSLNVSKSVFATEPFQVMVPPGRRRSFSARKVHHIIRRRIDVAYDPGWRENTTLAETNVVFTLAELIRINSINRAYEDGRPESDIASYIEHFRFAPTVIHIVGTVHSHRRNTQWERQAYVA